MDTHNANPSTANPISRRTTDERGTIPGSQSAHRPALAIRQSDAATGACRAADRVGRVVARASCLRWPSLRIQWPADVGTGLDWDDLADHAELVEIFR